MFVSVDLVRELLQIDINATIPKPAKTPIGQSEQTGTHIGSAINVLVIMLDTQASGVFKALVQAGDGIAEIQLTFDSLLDGNCTL